MHHSLFVHSHHVVETAREVQDDGSLLNLATYNHSFESQLKKTPYSSTITFSGTFEIAREWLDSAAKTMAYLAK